MFRLILVVALLFGCGGPAQHASVPTSKTEAALKQVDAITIPMLPEWIDRYADGKKGDVRFFNLTRVMKTYDVDRLGAIEIQNTYRDITRAEPGINLDEALSRAVKTVKAGTLESGVKREEMRSAKFIVVFDLDETIYDQYYSGGDACHEFKFQRSNGKMKFIHGAPGWQDTIKAITGRGGKVVLFSANLDDTTFANLERMTLDGVALTKSPHISGIMTNSYLIQQEKTEPPGSDASPRKGRPVIEPSKDLRFFDETLSRVVIIDDNPLRLFQFRNVRTFKKFHADEYCTTTNEVVKASYDSAMKTVWSELEETLEYMDKNPDIPFVTAYLPYSDLGRVAINFLMRHQVWSRSEAVDYLRKNPGIADRRF